MNDVDVRAVLFKAFNLSREKTQIPLKDYHTREDKLADELQYAIRQLDANTQKKVIEIFRKLL